jgi:D-aminoacyl-tRNA deacylase
MFFTLVVSDSDPASKTMSLYLENEQKFSPSSHENIFYSKKYDNIQLYKSDTPLIYAEDLDKKVPNSQFLVFLSKHYSSAKKPSLTCHFTGNFQDNCYGGNPCELGITFPSLQKAYLQHVSKHRDDLQSFEITIEATHHGPTSLKKPVLFVEIGSTEREWNNRDIAAIVCQSLLTILSRPINHKKKIGIGLGGNHYGSKFNFLLLNSDIAIGHICSKYNLRSINKSLLQQMITKCCEPITHIALDNKGLGKEKQRILDLINKSGLEIIKL